MKGLWRLLYKVSPWHRGYSEGWDDGVRTAVAGIRELLKESSDGIPNRDLCVLRDQLCAEIRD
ncbi:hypothetical protein [Kribbella sp. NPDC048928]|uniref:hypothetical protein n=1 Tax=Kribbella sp. NPDC048928 TaxID=3364111 RepID=UPI0037126E85